MDQFLAMAFAQLTGREGLRDIETCLAALGPKLYHAGFHSPVARSTLADANERRDWRIWADFAQTLIRRARKLYLHEEFGVQLSNTVYAFDSTTIDLCLSLFPWARFRRHKAAVKAHTLLDLRGGIPCFVRVTAGNVNDVRLLDELPLEPGAYYVMDRGYLDFARLHRFADEAAFFLVRGKRGLDFTRQLSRPVDKRTGLRCDQTISLDGPKSSLLYPQPLRRVAYTDQETGKHFVFLTNSFTLPALAVAQLYRCRWQVELFFKWIKQHLRIKSFFGVSENAVKTQIWIAVSVYVLVAIIKKKLGLDRSLYEILQILSLSLFEKSPILLVLNGFPDASSEPPRDNQLILFTS
jgi:transposase